MTADIKRTGFDPVAWLEAELSLSETDSTAFVYDLMESQSGECLPLIYQPFDALNDAHFADRGWAFDFVHTLGLGTVAEPRGRVLDFGPGDGWPSLIIAPFCSEVVGVDASAKRVAVCTANAARLGITNAEFVHVPAGEPLPFPAESFDAVAAASSIENSPDPAATLGELNRVLRPGGRLRIHYEALNRYRGDREREAWFANVGPGRLFIIIYDRQVAAERVRQYRLSLDLAEADLQALFARHGSALDYTGLTAAVLTELQPAIAAAAVCDTQHPSGNTWAKWLSAAGFSTIEGTHGGGPSAKRILCNLKADQRPADLAGVDEMLRPYVAVIVAMPVPLELDPLLTAVK